MANRILLKDTFKVSKPGVDVLTATNPNDFLLDDQKSTMGSYSSGVVNPASSGYYTAGFTTNFIIPVPNTLSHIPFVICQQTNSDNTASGPWRYVKSVTFAETVDTTPPSLRYYSKIEANGFTFGNTLNLIQVALYGTSLTPVRYHAFYIKAADTPFSPGDVIPNGLAWADVNSPAATANSSNQTIANLGTGVEIVLKIVSDVNQPSNNNFEMFVTVTPGSPTQQNGGTFKWATNSNTQYIVVQNGDSVQFSMKSNDSTLNRMVNYTVYNVSNSDFVVDTFYLRNKYVLNDPTPVNFPNVTGTNTGSTSTTISNINVTINIRLDFNTPYTGYINGVFFNNVSQSSNYAVQNLDVVTFTFQPSSTYSGTVTVRAVEAAVNAGTFTVNITVPAENVVGDWSNMSATAIRPTTPGTLTASTNVVTLNNFTGGSHTLQVSVSSGGASTTFRAYVNNVLSATRTGAGNVTITVNPNDTVYFNGTQTGYGQWSASVTVYDNTTSQNVDTFSIFIAIESLS